MERLQADEKRQMTRPQFSHHADNQYRCDLLRGYREVAAYQRLPLLCAVGMPKIKVVLYRGFTFFHIFTPFFGEKDPNGDLISHRCDPRRNTGLIIIIIYYHFIASRNPTADPSRN